MKVTHVSTPSDKASVVQVGRVKYDLPFELWMREMQAHVLRAFASGPVFTTDSDVDELWALYLEYFDTPEDKQYHNCNCCKQFIRNYGGLVTVDTSGFTRSLLWSNKAPIEYSLQAKALATFVEYAKVSGVFYHDSRLLGTPASNGWKHMWVEQPERPRSVLSAYQRMSEKRESHKNMHVALSKWSEQQLTQVVQLLSSESLYRSEKVLGQAEFLLKMKGIKNKNLFWREVALAPEGFMHPRSSMIGTLLEDLEAGLSIAVAAERFKSKMHPLQYQRPTAPPSMQTIKQAEELLAKMGIERSLERRYATMKDCTPFWLPNPAKSSGGVFDHLKTNATKDDWSAPAVTMTWVKFRDTVLPSATEISIYTVNRGPYSAFLTAVHEDAPNILQWNNAVSWYFHHGGSMPRTFNVNTSMSKVKALLYQPSMPLKHQGEGVMFAIDGAYDSVKTPLCLFPESLKAELHSVRSVIEAHSRAKYLTPTTDQVAGLMFKSGTPWNCTLQVKCGSSCQVYKLDRWD